MAARPVFSTVTAAPMRDPRGELTACLLTPVLWRRTVRALSAAGVTRYVEAGRERVLGDLVLETLAAGQGTDARSQLLDAR